jgi:hypothetical protein
MHYAISPSSLLPPPLSRRSRAHQYSPHCQPVVVRQRSDPECIPYCKDRLLVSLSQSSDPSYLRTCPLHFVHWCFFDFSWASSSDVRTKTISLDGILRMRQLPWIICGRVCFGWEFQGVGSRVYDFVLLSVNIQVHYSSSATGSVIQDDDLSMSSLQNIILNLIIIFLMSAF